MNLDVIDRPPATLGQILAARAAETPDAVAIVAENRRPLTYAGLWAHLQQVGAALRAFGIGHRDRVAVVLPNGPEMATAFLAVSACAANAPLNPAYRADDFDFYLTDLDAKAVIVLADDDSPVRAVARAKGIQILNLTPHVQDAAGLFTLTGEARLALATPASAPAPDDRALWLHTSGTTSRPKLVPLTHMNICASARSIALTLALTPEDRCLNVMPLFHIHGLMGALLSSLTAGASVVCTPGFSAPRFFAWLESFHPTWFSAVPTIHQAVLAHARQHPIGRHDLRLVRSSSAALPLQVIHELEQVFQVPVIEAYGMTEAAHQMASNPLPPATRKPGSVGRAAGPEVAIIDEAGVPLPVGKTGEVSIRGVSVTLGYEANPAANASAFTNGWFRTGDQGYLDADGYLFLTGRLKELINRGGEKIAPRDVDEALLTHPAVAEAVTFAVPHPTLGEDVAAAVVLRPGRCDTAAEIRQFLFDRVADFKIPSQVVLVTEIPKGSTGKIQRIGLAARLSDALTPEGVAPRTDLEMTITRLYAEVLEGRQPGVTDNFFALGGDSLRATQLMARLRSELDVELPLGTLFRKPTVAELAAEVAETMAASERGMLADVLAEMAALSDEEVQRLLVNERGEAAS